MTTCGTVAGYSAHRYRHERPCTPCCDARAEYQRARRTAVGVQTVIVEIPTAIVLSSNKRLHWAPEADHKATLRFLGKLNARFAETDASSEPDRHAALP